MFWLVNISKCKYCTVVYFRNIPTFKPWVSNVCFVQNFLLFSLFLFHKSLRVSQTNFWSLFVPSRKNCLFISNSTWNNWYKNVGPKTSAPPSDTRKKWKKQPYKAPGGGQERIWRLRHRGRLLRQARFLQHSESSPSSDDRSIQGLMNNLIDALKIFADWGNVLSPVGALRVASVFMSPLFTLRRIVAVMSQPVSIMIEKQVVVLTVAWIMWAVQEIEQGTEMLCPNLEWMRLLKKVITLWSYHLWMRRTSLQQVPALSNMWPAASFPDSCFGLRISVVTLYKWKLLPSAKSFQGLFPVF